MRSLNIAVTGKGIYVLYYTWSRLLERKDNVRLDKKIFENRVLRDYFKCIVLFIYKGNYQICHEKWLLIWSRLSSSILLVTDTLVKDTKKICLLWSQYIKGDLEFSSHNPWSWFQVLQYCKKANIFQWGRRKNDREVQNSTFDVIVKAQWWWWALKEKEMKERNHIYQDYTWEFFQQQSFEIQSEKLKQCT